VHEDELDGAALVYDGGGGAGIKTDNPVRSLIFRNGRSSGEEKLLIEARGYNVLRRGSGKQRNRGHFHVKALLQLRDAVLEKGYVDALQQLALLKHKRLYSCAKVLVCLRNIARKDALCVRLLLVVDILGRACERAVCWCATAVQRASLQVGRRVDRHACDVHHAVLEAGERRDKLEGLDHHIV